MLRVAVGGKLIDIPATNQRFRFLNRLFLPYILIRCRMKTAGFPFVVITNRSTSTWPGW